MTPKLTVTVTKTADGQRDYVQIMSSDMVSVNVVLIADEIVVDDHRATAERLALTRAVIEECARRRRFGQSCLAEAVLRKVTEATDGP